MFTSAKVSFSSTFGAWPSTSQELFHLITQHHAIYSDGRAKAAQDVRHGACGNCRPSSFSDRLVGSDATADAWAAASDLLSPEHDNSRLSNPWPKTSGLREPRKQAIRTSASWVSVGLWSTRPGFCMHPTPCYGRGLRWRSVVFFFFKRGRWCRREREKILWDEKYVGSQLSFCVPRLSAQDRADVIRVGHAGRNAVCDGWRQEKDGFPAVLTYLG